jgi:hypothetical protein
MTSMLHRIMPFIPSATDVERWADICLSADEWADIRASAAEPARKRGRPRGPQPQRKSIPLPDGDMLTPLFSTFGESTGLSAKALQRMRHRLPVTMISGVAYVKDREARAILAAPAKPRRGRRR